MRILDLNQLKFINVKKKNIQEGKIIITKENLLDCSTKLLVDILLSNLYEPLNKLDGNCPTHFTIEIQDKTLCKNEYKDLAHLTANVFTELLLKTDLRNEEKRLAIPHHLLNNVVLGRIVYLKLINYKTTFNQFTIDIVINGKKFFIV